MGEYHLFPQPSISDVAKYNSRPLPKTPTSHPAEVYLQTTASYESIIDHRIPSPFLCDQEEIQQIWSRASQQSFKASQPNPSRGRSLLPPAPQYSRGGSTVQAVPCRLSSASTESLGYSPSPVVAKRSATPDLLQKLSTDLEGLSFADRVAEANTISPESSAPSTPSDSFSSSTTYHSAGPYQRTSFASTSTTVDMIEMSPPTSTSPKAMVAKKMKPINVFTSTTPGHRNISAPMPSPSYSPLSSPLLHSHINDATMPTSYRPYRAAPSVPSTTPTGTPTVEVSRIDWDDDDDLSKLARMKKSITDLRVVTGRTPKLTKERTNHKTESIPIALAIDHSSTTNLPSRPRAQRSMTAPTQPVIPHHHQQQQQHNNHHHHHQRPSLPHTVSANRTRTSLPPLPVRTSSTKTTTATPQPPTKPPTKKHSIRLTPTSRRRAASDTPLHHHHHTCPSLASTSTSTFPSTPTTSPTSKSSRKTSSSTGSSSRYASANSSLSSTPEKNKPLPHSPSMRRATGGKGKGLPSKRVSVMSLSSIAAAGGKKSRSTVRVVSFGRLRRLFRWSGSANKCAPAAIRDA